MVIYRTHLPAGLRFGRGLDDHCTYVYSCRANVHVPFFKCFKVRLHHIHFPAHFLAQLEVWAPCTQAASWTNRSLRERLTAGAAIESGRQMMLRSSVRRSRISQTTKTKKKKKKLLTSTSHSLLSSSLPSSSSGTTIKGDVAAVRGTALAGLR